MGVIVVGVVYVPTFRFKKLATMLVNKLVTIFRCTLSRTFHVFIN